MKFKNFVLTLKVLSLSALFLAAGCKKSNENPKLSAPQARAKFVLDSILASTPNSIIDNNGVKTLAYSDGRRKVTGISVIKDKILEPENSVSAAVPYLPGQVPKEWYEDIDVDAASVPYLIALGAQWMTADGWVVTVTSMTMNGTPASNSEILPDGTIVTVNRRLTGTTYGVSPANFPTVSKALKWRSGLEIRVTVKPPGGVAQSELTGQVLEYNRTLTALRFN
uniref:hypothetical protein n=1 Tax=Pedobacter schmidteae TaxID=2201271 RepID=UPI000EB1DD1A|nr:hypothetical protein [Pedobacter schmidteae]